jgi:hypothetical protein
MRKAKLFGCLLSMAVATTGLMAVPKIQPHNQVIYLSDLSEQAIEDFSRGDMHDVVVACPEGSSLPFKLTLKGEFLALESALKPLQLNILKTCYVRCDEKEHFLFSTDLQAWKDFSEFFTGEVRVTVKRESGEPMTGLQLELNQRRN